MKRYMTVVFEYDAGDVLTSKLAEAFASPSQEYEGTMITAISLEDEIKRVEELEDSL